MKDDLNFRTEWKLIGSLRFSPCSIVLQCKWSVVCRDVCSSIVMPVMALRLHDGKWMGINCARLGPIWTSGMEITQSPSHPSLMSRFYHISKSNVPSQYWWPWGVLTNTDHTSFYHVCFPFGKSESVWRFDIALSCDLIIKTHYAIWEIVDPRKSYKSSCQHNFDPLYTWYQSDQRSVRW